MSTANKLLQAASGAAGGDRVYVEDVFSTNLYAGNSSSQTITTGINASDNEALFWAKCRDAALSHRLADTVRGINKVLICNDSAGEATSGDFTSASSTGITVNYNSGNINQSGNEDVLWSFRKQAGFFDIVTYTGNGSHGHLINHDLGCIPGMIWIKRTDTGEDWMVYHIAMDASTPEQYSMKLNSSASRTSGFMYDGSGHTAPTATQVNLSSAGQVNQNGGTFVMYLFAAGTDSASQIFGEYGDEAIVKCGAFEYTGGQDIDLGFEPQWIIYKNASGSSTSYWGITDMMRGWTGVTDSHSYYVRANANNAESDNGVFKLKENGFRNAGGFSGGDRIIYTAIRRPMKPPETGTAIFTPVTNAGTSAAKSLTSTARVVDLAFLRRREGEDWVWSDRLAVGEGRKIRTNRDTTVENDPQGVKEFDKSFGITIGDNSDANGSGYNYIYYMITRAAKFFDVVSYIGNGSSNRSITHNLGATPEFMVIKKLYGTNDNWVTYDASTGATKYMRFNTNAQPATTSGIWNNTAPTASVFTVDGTGGRSEVNTSNHNYAAYLFATVAGVSKIGSYTGTGSDINVDCGFSAGARFVLIKRNNDAGNWFVYDSVRGINAVADPYILLNSNSAEDSSNDDIDPLSSGFTIPSGSNVNTNGGTYIFLAIAQR